MPTTTESRRENPFGLNLGPYNEAVSRAQDFNTRIVEGVKTTGLTTLDAYDKAVQTLTDLQVRIAEASQVDWVAAQARAQAGLVREVSSAYTKAARAVLS